MKPFLLIACFFSIFDLYSEENIQLDVKSITYETLAADPWTDHVIVFNELFKATRISSFLEFGLGKATKYFLENCDEVTSVEISVSSRKSRVEPWYYASIQALAGYHNWNPILYHGSVILDYYNQERSYPEENILLFTAEINDLCDSVFNNQRFDIAFVDPGVTTRGDIVNALFNRVDILVAHDTNHHQIVYGWSRIVSMQNYKKIHFSYGQGTTVWVKTDMTDLINALEVAADRPNLKPVN